MVAGMTASYPASYYAATAHAAPERPPLEGEVDAEVCIVGGGFTGLSAGLELAERGHRVVLLEATRIGWGASGRNGGQIVNGLNARTRDDRAALRPRGRRFHRHGRAGGRADHPRAGGALRHPLRPQGRQHLRRLHREADARARGQAGALAPARARQLRDARPRRPARARGERPLPRGHDRPDRRAPASAQPRARAGGGARRARRRDPRDEPGDPDRRPARAAGGAHGERGGAGGGGGPRRQRLSRRGGAGARRPDHAVLDPDHRDRAARRPRARAAAERQVRRGRALRARLLPALGRPPAALRRRHRLWRHRPGRHPRQAGAEPRAGVPAAQGRARRLRLVGELRDLVQPGAAARPARPGRLFRPRVQWPRRRRQPSLRANPRRGGARRPVAVRRVRAGALDRFPGRTTLSPCPIPFSDRGGMACATALACNRIRKGSAG